MDTEGRKILDGKVALITGGARGVGKELAITFSKAGANVAVCDLNMESLKEVEEEIKLAGGQCLPLEADISIKSQVEAMMDKIIERFGQIDILVNNAGVCISSPILETSVEEWDTNMNVNLKGTFLCLQSAAKYMIEARYGKIVNISSVCGRGATSEGISYSAAKAGVIQVTYNAAAELGKYNINVNSIAPGFIATPMVKLGKTPQEYEEMIAEFSKSNVLGKTGLPQDIANTALFLVSDESSYISGQTIPVDGGRMNRM
ncbi:SDR family NAD(P)-dependent oxidoreductase [Ammoniphilus sp. 3BR4]|uniref:SDR family NAD(P)-dependent oxidoreductase n=1 Tax=Ammoniphilus sp. 3BR4 TaxID=3158265 RepID=UPI0034652BF6